MSLERWKRRENCGWKCFPRKMEIPERTLSGHVMMGLLYNRKILRHENFANFEVEELLGYKQVIFVCRKISQISHNFPAREYYLLHSNYEYAESDYPIWKTCKKMTAVWKLMKTPERSRTSRVGHFLVLSPQNSLCDVMWRHNVMSHDTLTSQTDIHTHTHTHTHTAPILWPRPLTRKVINLFMCLPSCSTWHHFPLESNLLSRNGKLLCNAESFIKLTLLHKPKTTSGNWAR